MKRKIIFFTAMLVVFISLSACTKEAADALGIKDQITEESEGYDSPESAVTAYIEGLKAGDVNQMVSTFSVKPYAENYDLQSFIERMNMYNFHSSPLPAVDDMSRNLNIEKRRSEIVDSIRYQYIALQRVSVDLEKPMFLGTESEQDEFLKELTGQLTSEDISSAKLIGFIPPEQLNETYSSEANQKNLEKTAASYGADQIKSQVAVIEIGESQYVLCFDTVEYEGKWYNLQLGGNLSNLLGITVTASGTIPLDVDPQYKEEWENLIVPVK